MMFRNVGRVKISALFIKEMTNPHKQLAYAIAMSRFIVIEARVNPIDDTVDQVIFDPSGVTLVAINEPDTIPAYELVFTQHKPLSIFDNPYTAELRLKP